MKSQRQHSAKLFQNTELKFPRSPTLNALNFPKRKQACSLEGLPSTQSTARRFQYGLLITYSPVMARAQSWLFPDMIHVTSNLRQNSICRLFKLSNPLWAKIGKGSQT